MRFAQKLKALKLTLKVWNRNIFRNINTAINQDEDEVLKAEVAYDSFSSEHNMKQLCMAKKLLNDKLEIQEIFWKQKANVKWLREGDNNTKLFLQSTKNKRQRLYPSRIRASTGIWLIIQEDIANEAFFSPFRSS